MSEKEINAYRLTSLEEPTDEMLAYIMRASIEQFINSCPQAPVMADEEIAAEVNAVRYEA